ncbi:PAS domain-containing sensor histidine kinase [Nitrosococcus wardiae]|uniref:PAS domain-containing sensor histidine kinase n=1 Tax=Nitrosococcus wardiae TaxID=1814290 RepID=UPI00141B3F0D|nr:ATP-binding protein [Nitrosococcus wardiae]
MANHEECSKIPLSEEQKNLQTQPAASPTQDMECLVQELQASQTELEIKKQELQQSQQALEESRNRCAELYDFAPITYLTLDCQGYIQEINLTGAMLLGVERSHLVGELFSVWVVQRDIPVFLSFLKAVYQGGGKSVQELRLKRWDGKIIYAHLESLPLRRKKKQESSCRIALLDVSTGAQSQIQLQQSQEKLFQWAQLILLGELGAGLAHEINQPLAAIATYAQECVRRLRASIRDPDSLLRAVEEIAIQAERASGIIQRLRQRVPRELQQPQTIQINKIILRAMEWMEPRLDHEGILVSLVMPKDLPPIFVNPIEVEQVLLNLLSNVIDAMTNDPSSRRELKLTARLNAAREIEVRISNTRTRFAIDRLEQVFESLFTIQPKGGGLGLAISRSLIEKHGGQLWAMLCREQGTAFRFTLPVLPVKDNQNE